MTWAVALAAPTVVVGSSTVKPQAHKADIVFLGEQHDNPAHHAVQASWTRALEPQALVFEMLTVEQAAAVTPDNRQNEAALQLSLEWDGSGWPDFSMYFPIFAAAPDAVVIGAGVPRDQLRSLMEDDLADVVGAETAERFGLDEPLPEAQQSEREALQRVAHCNALPEDLLPRMVSVQRLRDTALAQAALSAFETHGGPVIVITGNGHARTDWGAPFILAQAAPDLAIFSLGQGEAGQLPGGSFAAVIDGPEVDRGDPCDAFK